MSSSSDPHADIDLQIDTSGGSLPQLQMLSFGRRKSLSRLPSRRGVLSPTGDSVARVPPPSALSVVGAAGAVGGASAAAAHAASERRPSFPPDDDAPGGASSSYASRHAQRQASLSARSERTLAASSARGSGGGSSTGASPVSPLGAAAGQLPLRTPASGVGLGMYSGDGAYASRDAVCLARAVVPFAAEREGELFFEVGDLISVTNCTAVSGWWEGRIGEREGRFPSTFVRRLPPSRSPPLVATHAAAPPTPHALAAAPTLMRVPSASSAAAQYGAAPAVPQFAHMAAQGSASAGGSASANGSDDAASPPSLMGADASRLRTPSGGSGASLTGPASSVVPLPVPGSALGVTSAAAAPAVHDAPTAHRVPSHTGAGLASAREPSAASQHALLRDVIAQMERISAQQATAEQQWRLTNDAILRVASLLEHALLTSNSMLPAVAADPARPPAAAQRQPARKQKARCTLL